MTMKHYYMKAQTNYYKCAIKGPKLYSHDFEELFDILKEYLYFLHCFTIAVKNCHDN